MCIRIFSSYRGRHVSPYFQIIATISGAIESRIFGLNRMNRIHSQLGQGKSAGICTIHVYKVMFLYQYWIGPGV